MIPKVWAVKAWTMGHERSFIINAVFFKTYILNIYIYYMIFIVEVKLV